MPEGSSSGTGRGRRRHLRRRRARVREGGHQVGVALGQGPAPQEVARVVAQRAGHDDRQAAELVALQPGRRLAEVVAGRRADPVHPGAELDAVQVQLQDAPLGQQQVHLQGGPGLRVLPQVRAVLGQPEGPGQLHGDGGAAAVHVAQRAVHLPGLPQGPQLHARVLVEGVVLQAHEHELGVARQARRAARTPAAGSGHRRGSAGPA